jgi:predicted HicB family RNase H-like nuclease
MDQKQQELLLLAQRLYSKNTDWVTFFREVLGVSGAVRQSYPDAGSLAQFEQSECYNEIQLMLAKLRDRGVSAGPSSEVTRVITVRLPQCLHDSLRVEAGEMRTSMNKLCISKLLQVVDQDLVPTDKESKPEVEASKAPTPAPVAYESAVA